MKHQHYVLTKDWVRHGKYSGYERLIDFFSFSYSIIKKHFLPYRIARFFGKHTLLQNYKGETVAKEWSILLRFWECKTVHIIYGDMDFYYLNYLKRFPFNLRKSQLVVTFHHPPQELEKRLKYNKTSVLGSLDKIIVMGRNQSPFFKPYTNAQIRFIPHGIDLDYFNYRHDIRRSDRILIIGISHRDHQRNIAIIKAVNQMIPVKFTVVMSLKYASLYKKEEQVEIETQAISDADLLSYYQTSKAVLLSLTDCTASNTILEALACGCPLVVNNVGAVRDYIPVTSGVPIFNTADIEGSALYIKQLIEDSNYLKTISVLQRKLAENYDWKKIAKETEDFIFQGDK